MLKQIGSQVPALDNLKCCKNDWCLQVQFASGKFGTTLTWKSVNILWYIFIPVMLILQDPFQVQALDNFKLFI